MRQTARDTK